MKNLSILIIFNLLLISSIYAQNSSIVTTFEFDTTYTAAAEVSGFGQRLLLTRTNVGTEAIETLWFRDSCIEPIVVNGKPIYTYGLFCIGNIGSVITTLYPADTLKMELYLNTAFTEFSNTDSTLYASILLPEISGELTNSYVTSDTIKYSFKKGANAYFVRSHYTYKDTLNEKYKEYIEILDPEIIYAENPNTASVWIIKSGIADSILDEVRSTRMAQSIRLLDEGFIPVRNFTPRFGPLSIDQNLANIPTQLEIISSYPNPFNPTVSIVFNHGTIGSIGYKIHDIQGRLIDEQNLGVKNQGNHTIQLDFTRQKSGVYFVTLVRNNSEFISKKVTLLK